MMMKKCFLMAACVGMAALASSADAALIARWDFDETSGSIASDSVGGNDGVLQNVQDPTFLQPQWKPGLGVDGGGAIQFSSIAQDVVIVPDFDYGSSGNFTTSIWTKTQTVWDDNGAVAGAPSGRLWQYFWSTATFGAPGGFNYYIENYFPSGPVPGQNRVRVEDNTTTTSSGGTLQLDAGLGTSTDWRMFTVSYSSTDGAKYYVNGVLTGSDASLTGGLGDSVIDHDDDSMTPDVPADMYFGARADINTTRLFGGSIGHLNSDPDLGLLDNAAIWDVPLSAGQVMDVFANGVSNNPVPEPTTLLLFAMGTACSAALRRRRAC